MYFKKRRSNNHFIISALIIVLVTVSLVFVLDRRGQKQRDARRFADIKQMQTVLSYHLELYGEYPQVSEFTCFSEIEGLIEGLVPWLVTLPVDPKEGNSANNPKSACYNYRSDNGQEYKIRTALEQNNFSMIYDGGSSDDWYEVFTSGATQW